MSVVAIGHRRVLESLVVASFLMLVVVVHKVTSEHEDVLLHVRGWIASAALEQNDLALRVIDRHSDDGPVTFLIVGSDKRSELPSSLPVIGSLNSSARASNTSICR